MDAQYHDHMVDQIAARIQDLQSGDPAAFARHMARIRQRPDRTFEHRAPDGTWCPYTPGGFPFEVREVDALRARGDTITEDNVSVYYS